LQNCAHTRGWRLSTNRNLRATLANSLPIVKGDSRGKYRRHGSAFSMPFHEIKGSAELPLRQHAIIIMIREIPNLL
jgi:hypothetical protein